VTTDGLVELVEDRPCGEHGREPIEISIGAQHEDAIELLLRLDLVAIVLEAGSGRSFKQPGDLIRGEHPRQLARIVRAGQLMAEVGTAERDGEEEAQRRGLRIHLRGMRALLDLRELEAADVVAGRAVGRAAENLAKASTCRI
jgi:hypothetical protein